MKKTLCLYFNVHLPARLRSYRFFDIGHSHLYFDEFKIGHHMRTIANECYLPMNHILLELIKQYNQKFKLSLSITGEFIEQAEKYAPEVIESFQELAKTGCVEFVCETYSHSLIFLKDEQEFQEQMKKSAALIKKYFGQKPTTARLTGCIYSDQIGEKISQMGFNTMLTEGARHILGWKSPNHVYASKGDIKLKLLLRNTELSERISFQFSDQGTEHWPITCEKFTSWLNATSPDEQVVNIFLDYLAFGQRHKAHSGIFDFLKQLPNHILTNGKYEFETVSEASKKYKAREVLNVPYPISWHEAECDLSIFLGNDMQKDAFLAMSQLGEKIHFVNDKDITADWRRLQDSDNFHYMCTRWQADPLGRRFRSPYNSPYDAYINYMNILADLRQRLEAKMEKHYKKLLEDKKVAELVYREMCSSQIGYTSSQLHNLIEIIDNVKENTPTQKNNKKVEVNKN